MTKIHTEIIKTLQEGDEKFRLLVEKLPVAVFMHNGDKFIYVNPVIEKITGYRKKELIGKSFWSIIHPDYKQMVKARGRKRILGGKDIPSRYELKIICKNKQVKLLDVSATIISYKGQTVVLGLVSDITEKKKVQNAFKESEYRFRTLVENSPFSIELHDKSGCLVKTNKAWEKLWGLKSSDVIGKFNILKDKQAKEKGIDVYFRRAVKGETVTLPDMKYDASEAVGKGRCRWLRSTFYPINGRSKEVEYVVIIHVDITEQKLSEEVVRKNESLLQGINNNLQSAMIYQVKVFKDGTRQLNYVSDSVKKFYGVTPEQAIKNVNLIYNQILKEDIARLKQAEDEAIKSKTIFKCEARINDSSGNIRWAYFVSTPSVLKDGTTIWDGIETDITERKQNEEKIKIISSAVKQSTEGMAVADLAGKLIFVNDAWCKMHGYKSYKDLIGKNLKFFHNQTQIENDVKPFNKKVVKFGTYSGEVGHVTKDGKIFPTLMTTTLLKDDQSKPYAIVGIAKDITEKKQAEDQIIKLNKILIAIKEITQNIFQINDKEKLLKNVCESISKYAYKMVWIGMCDEKYKNVNPVAQAGFEKGYLKSIKIKYDTSKYGMGPTGVAIRTGKSNLLNDITADPRYKPWKKQALKRGYSSSIAIPIYNSHKVIGALNIYSEKKYAFDRAEVALLEELSHDISIALRGLDNVKALEQSEEKYRVLAEKSRDGIAIVSLDGKMKYVNPYLANLLGYKESEIIGQSVLKFTHPDFHKATKEIIKKFNNGVVDLRFEAADITKNGRRIDIEDTIGLVQYEGEKCGLVVVRDITERKKFEIILQEKENKYHGLFETSRDAVMTLDPPSWNFTSANKMTLKMFKAKNEAEFLLYPPWKLSPKLQPDGQPSDKKAKEMIGVAMEKGSNLFEWVHKRINGEEFLAEVFLSKVELANKVFVQAIVRDITDQKLREEKLRKKTEDLERLNKLMVGRERKMIDLKREVEELKK